MQRSSAILLWVITLVKPHLSLNLEVLSDSSGTHHNVTLIASGETKFLVPSNDNFLSLYMRQTGTFDSRELAFILSLVKTGSTVLEIGSNFGPYSPHIARAVGKEGKLYCFEPFRLMYQILTANIALNGLSNVYAFNVAVGDKSTRNVPVEFPDLNHPDNYGASSLLGKKPWIFRHTVEQKTDIVDIDNFGIDSRIDLIKIDVEGMEYEVLLGARMTIITDNPTIYAENEKSNTWNNLSFEEFMETKFGYSCHRPLILSVHNIVLCTKGGE